MVYKPFGEKLDLVKLQESITNRVPIQSAAGAKSSQGMNLEEFIALIKNSGFTPVERDSLYNELKVYDKD